MIKKLNSKYFKKLPKNISNGYNRNPYFTTKKITLPANSFKRTADKNKINEYSKIIEDFTHKKNEEISIRNKSQSKHYTSNKKKSIIIMNSSLEEIESPVKKMNNTNIMKRINLFKESLLLHYENKKQKKQLIKPKRNKSLLCSSFCPIRSDKELYKKNITFIKNDTTIELNTKNTDNNSASFDLTNNANNTIKDNNNIKYDKNINAHQSKYFIKNKYDSLLKRTKNLLDNYQKIVEFYQNNELKK